ncbi:hypothetical protein KY285_013806 [Solanum tuberosum]|nr:hypothetical protein KY285_013806 [Solanum tuberosum]
MHAGRVPRGRRGPPPRYGPKARSCPEARPACLRVGGPRGTARASGPRGTARASEPRGSIGTHRASRLNRHASCLEEEGPRGTVPQGEYNQTCFARARVLYAFFEEIPLTLKLHYFVAISRWKVSWLAAWQKAFAQQHEQVEMRRRSHRVGRFSQSRVEARVRTLGGASVDRAKTVIH